MTGAKDLLAALQARGVIVHAPEATVVADVDPERIEPGVEIFPGTTIRGERTLLGAGTRLGLAGGGYFDSVATGRNVTLYGGYFHDAVFLDGVTLRGHAEARAGTLLEEGAEGGHHVGLKMTILMPFVVVGSLVNFCDALFAGGTSRRNHSEIGSTLALYNFTPWGDKFASLFGDVPRGVFLRSLPIFLGGQTQVVSPVKIGYGSVIAAGCAVRGNVPEERLYGEAAPSLDLPFDRASTRRLPMALRNTAEYIANLWCLRHWYSRVRLPVAAGDARLEQLYARAMEQLEAGIEERLQRLDNMMGRLANEGQRRGASGAGDRRAAPSRRSPSATLAPLVERWPELRAILATEPPEPRPTPNGKGLAHIVAGFRAGRQKGHDLRYVDFIKGLSAEAVRDGQAHLQRYIDGMLERLRWPWD